MTSSLRRIFSHGGAIRTGVASRSFSSEALVEVVKSVEVVIFSPAKTATQQGSGKVGKWKMNFMSTQNEEAAMDFAEKHGWDYVVKKRHTPLLKVKAYAENFKWKFPATASNEK